MSVEEHLQLTQAREHLADVEQRHFSGAAHLDELRAAYVALQQAERAVVEVGHVV